MTVDTLGWTSARIERTTNGQVFDSSSWIGHLSGNTWWLGWTFGLVPAGMIQGITINRARLKYADAIDRSGSVSYNVAFQLAAAPAFMTTTLFNVSERPRSSLISANSASTPATGPYMTNDLTTALQELFDDFDPSGNQIAMTLLTTSASAGQFIEWGAGTSPDVNLEIDWEASGPVGGGGGPQQQSMLSLVGGHLGN